MTKRKSKKSAPKSESRRAPVGGNSTSLKMTKELNSVIDKLAKKDSNGKKNKGAKKPENGIVRRLTKNSLINNCKDNVKAAKQWSSKKEK